MRKQSRIFALGAICAAALLYACDPDSLIIGPSPSPVNPSDTTVVTPVDTTVVEPVDTTIVDPVDTTIVVPVDTTVVDPVVHDPKGNVYGYVMCGAQGLEGVVVSDGIRVTTTGSDGYYELTSAKANGYVFISTPSGYAPAQKGVLPQFYGYLTGNEDVKERVDFSLTKEDQSEYTVLLLGDMHLADRMHDFEQFRTFTDEVQQFRADNPGRKIYAITLGDMAWDIFWYRYDLEDYLAEVNADLVDLPIYHTIGNHDHESGVAGDFDTVVKYRKILGPTYYSFNIGGYHYIVLDDILCKNTTSQRSFTDEITDDQLRWLKADLEHVSKSTPLVVTMHSPLYYNTGYVALNNGFNGFIKMFSGYKHTLVATGHTHIIYNTDKLTSSVPVYESNSGAVCGAWWMTGSNFDGMHLSGDGTPGGYRIMDVSGTDWEWRFKGTDRPDDYQFRTYDRNCLQLSAAKWTPNATSSGKTAFEAAVGEYAYASSDNYVLLNIWDYDPSWTVEVTENGKSLPVTQLSDVKDPLYLVCYEAYEYEHHYDNSIYYSAYTTKHMFRVQASSATSTLDIKVTDRFGNVYTEQMKRPKEFTIDNYR